MTTAALLIGLLCGTPAQASVPVAQFRSGGESVVVERVADGFAITSAIAFLPDGRALVASRLPAALSVVDVASGKVTKLEGLPPIHAAQDSGLHDVVPHPDFARNQWIYFSYSDGVAGASALALDRARLQGDALVERERLFLARPAAKENFHFGGRIVFDGAHLYLSSGDRELATPAQDRASHLGKILRLDHAGKAAAGNPYLATADALPEIFSLGHRNPQGLARDPGGGALLSTEHGPYGGDELNRIGMRENYGWPQMTWGYEYAGGMVGKGPHPIAGMSAPLHVWSPSIAPSDLLVYSGAALPGWRGSLLLGAMGGRCLIRVVLEGERVQLEERLLMSLKQRVRSVEADAAGNVYVGTDNGWLLRLRPAAPR